MSRNSESQPAGAPVLVGKVTKPHGLKGEVKIFPFSGDPAGLTAYPELILDGPEGRQSVRVIQARIVGGQAVLQLAGIHDRDQAEALADREVWVDARYLPSLAEDEYYWHRLEGLRVVTAEGRELGRIIALWATGGHDVLVVAEGEKEYLIPAVGEILLQVDEAAGVVVVAPPPGLLEINQ